MPRKKRTNHPPQNAEEILTLLDHDSEAGCDFERDGGRRCDFERDGGRRCGFGLCVGLCGGLCGAGEREWSCRKWCDLILLILLIGLAFVTVFGSGALFYLDYRYGGDKNVMTASGTVTNRLVDEVPAHGKVVLDYFYNAYDGKEYFGAVWLKVSDYGSSGMNSTERLAVMGHEYPPGGAVPVYYRKYQPGVNLAVFPDYLEVPSELFLYKWISLAMTGSFLLMVVLIMVVVAKK